MSTLLSIATQSGVSLYSHSHDSAPVFSQSLPPHAHTTPTQPTITSVQWSSDGSRLLVVAGARVNCFMKDGEKLGGMEMKEPISTALLITRSSSILLSQNATISSYAFPTPTSTPLQTFSGHPESGTILSSSINSDSILLASCTLTSLLIHSLATTSKFTLSARPSPSYSLIKFHPTKKSFLVAGTPSGVIHFFDTNKPAAPIRSLSIANGSSVTNFLFSPVGNPLLVVITQNGLITLVDTQFMKVVGKFESGEQELGKGKVVICPDGRSVMVVGKGGRGIRTLDLKSGKKGVWWDIGQDVTGLAFQPMPPRPKSSSPTKSTITKGSTVLADTINRMRASHQQQQSALEKKKTGTPPPLQLEEMFSPVRASSTEVDELPTKHELAESIKAEARTSTIRSLDQLQHLASSLRLATSTSHSHPLAHIDSDLDEDYQPLTPLPSRQSISSPEQPLFKLTSGSARLSQSLSASLKLRKSEIQESEGGRKVSKEDGGLSTTKKYQSSSSATSSPVGEISLRLPTPSYSVLPKPKEKKRVSSWKDLEVENEGTLREEGKGEGTPTRSPLIVSRKKVREKAGREIKSKKERMRDQQSKAGLEAEGGRKSVSLLGVEKETERRKITPRLEQVSSPKTSGAPKKTEEGVVTKEVVQENYGGDEMIGEAVRSAIASYAEKTSQDIKNLHLEMLRSTFTQKVRLNLILTCTANLSTLTGVLPLASSQIEIRTLMDTYLGGELKALREENQMLREENRRLRKGRC